MVEHHGTRALQKQLVLLKARVVDHVLHAVPGLEHLDHVLPALAAAAGRIHGIDRHVAAGMGGEPVVGKHRIGRVAFALVLEEVDLHARGTQTLDGGCHFMVRGFRDGARLMPGRGALK